MRNYDEQDQEQKHSEGDFGVGSITGYILGFLYGEVILPIAHKIKELFNK